MIDDYYNPENIDELYDNEEDSIVISVWEYNYHDLARELVDD